MTLTITSITRLNREPNKKGVKHLAHCSVHIGGLMTLHGCLLVEHPEAGRVIWSPVPQGRAGLFEVSVRLEDDLRSAIADAAGAAYDALVANDNRASPVISAAVALVREIEARDGA